MTHRPLCFTLFCLAASIFSAEDWPMLAHDPARSGATSAEIKPPFKRRWYRDFSNEGILGGVQPVVARGKVFIGTMHGVFHAIDDITGRDVWTFKIPRGIFTTAAVSGDNVFVCGANGILYALNVDSGQVTWKYDPGNFLPFLSSPIPHAGKVYFCGRDGVIGALNERDGQVLWRVTIQTPIAQSPAIDAASNRLYIGAEDMCAYALSLTDGKKLWQSEKLQGYTFAGYYPVVVPEGGVVFTTRPFNSSRESQQTLKSVLKKLHGVTRREDKPDDKEEYPAIPHGIFSKEQNEKLKPAWELNLKEPDYESKMFSAIREELKSHPERRSVFILDSSTGKERGLPPIVFGEPLNGTNVPPIVMADRKIVMPVRTGVYNLEDAAYLNPINGDVSFVAGMRENIVASSKDHFALVLGSPLSSVFDDPAMLSAAGARLFRSASHGLWTHLPGGPRWTDGPRAPGDLIQQDLLLAWSLPDLGLRTLRGEALPPGGEFIPRGFGVFGSGSGQSSAAVLAGKSIYYLPQYEYCVGACLSAFEMTETHVHEKPPGTAPASDADRDLFRKQRYDFDFIMGNPKLVAEELKLTMPGVPASEDLTKIPLLERVKALDITDEELDKIIFETWDSEIERRMVPHIQMRLLRQAEELISKEWAPLAFPMGTYFEIDPNKKGALSDVPAGEASFAVFSDPAEIYNTLGTAWQYLPGLLQHKIREFVKLRLEKEDPILTERLDEKLGERRESFNFTPSTKVAHFRIRSAGLERLYPMWLYAHHSNDFDWLQKNWDKYRGLADSAKPGEWGADCRNAYLSGLIAFCRIAAKFKDEEPLAKARTKTLIALRERIEYERTMTRGGIYFKGAPRNGYTGPARWMFLTPEVARLCLQYASQIQKDLVSNYIDYHRPTYYLAWGMATDGLNAESTQSPISAAAHFAAKALLVSTPPDELEQCADLPWCRADMYYIQKLALVLRAHGDLIWYDVRKPKPFRE